MDVAENSEVLNEKRGGRRMVGIAGFEPATPDTP